MLLLFCVFASVLPFTHTQHIENLSSQGLSKNRTLTTVCSTICECYAKTTLPHIIVDCASKNLDNLERLAGLVPETISRLDVSKNKLQQLKENDKLFNRKMSELDVSRNQIKQIVGDFFKYFPNLFRLNLSRNELRNLTYSVFFNVKQLSYLDLSYNKFKTLPNKLFVNLHSLNVLNLSYNPLSEFMLHERNIFGRENLALDNANIKVMNLKNLSLARFPYSVLENNYNITQLYLSDNPLVEFPIAPETLEILGMAGTHLKRLVPMYLHYPALKELYLDRSHNLTRIEDYAFFHLQKIEIITMEGCVNLKEFNVLAFGCHRLDADYTFHSLKKLTLAKSGLTTLNVSLVHFLNRTAVVNLDGNPFHCDCRVNWVKNLRNISKNIRCSTPPSLQYLYLRNITDQSCKAKSQKGQSFVPVLSKILIFLTLCTAIFLTFLLCRKHKTREIVSMSPYSPYQMISREIQRTERLPAVPFI